MHRANAEHPDPTSLDPVRVQICLNVGATSSPNTGSGILNAAGRSSCTATHRLMTRLSASTQLYRQLDSANADDVLGQRPRAPRDPGWRHPQYRRHDGNVWDWALYNPGAEYHAAARPHQRAAAATLSGHHLEGAGPSRSRPCLGIHATRSFRVGSVIRSPADSYARMLSNRDVGLVLGR